ncbi:MAG: FlgD immunoglobulin-like domain containing protein [Candidatus Kapaibacterium sp.]
MKIIYVLLAFLSLPAAAFSQAESPYNNARIIHLGSEINTKDMDYAPCVSTDGTMFFVSNRPGSQLMPDKKSSHDIWMALQKFNQDTAFFPATNPEPAGNTPRYNLNSPLNEGAACISLDKKVLYFTGCQRPGGMGDCDLYMALLTYKGDTIGIEKVFQLSRTINSEYWDSQPSISPDNTRLYFASARPLNPRQQLDSRQPEPVYDMNIWYSDFNPETSQWQPAVPLPDVINTSKKENTPFIAADNKTLFFASDGHSPNYGGTDFYYSRLDEHNHWTPPVNLGKSLNTKESELFITANVAGTTLYFSSTRTDIPGAMGSLDIYAAKVPNILGEVNFISWQQTRTATVDITVSNDKGIVRAVSLGEFGAGRHTVDWDGKDANKQRVPPGSYTYEVKLGGVVDTKGRLMMK